MAFEWTEEATTEVVAVYKGKLEELMEANPDTEKADHSREALIAAAKAVGTSEASARIKLNKLNEYVRVTPKKSEPKASTGGGGRKRLNKAEQQAELVSAFRDHGIEDVDMEIVGKLTGKAAAHLAAKIREINSGD